MIDMGKSQGELPLLLQLIQHIEENNRIHASAHSHNDAITVMNDTGVLEMASKGVEVRIA